MQSTEPPGAAPIDIDAIAPIEETGYPTPFTAVGGRAFPLLARMSTIDLAIGQTAMTPKALSRAFCD